MKIVFNIRVGRARGHHSWSAHTPGVREGNLRGSMAREFGLLPVHPFRAHGSARRSTGIKAPRRNPIDVRMPNLSPG